MTRSRFLFVIIALLLFCNIAFADGAIVVPDRLTDLSDFPSTYSGQGSKCQRVNVAENAIEFFDCNATYAPAAQGVTSGDSHDHAGGDGAQIDHGGVGGLTDDDHTQYALLAGRAGGYTLIGGTGVGDNLGLSSTSNVTKGKITFGTSAYDEVNNRLGIGTNAPGVPLHVKGSASQEVSIQATNANSNAILRLSNDFRAWLFYIKGEAPGFDNFIIRDSTAGADRITILGTGAVAGNIGVGESSPTAALHLKAGTATASTAPFKFTSGVNLTTPEAGAVEWDGTDLYLTQTTGPTRKTVAYTDAIPTTSDWPNAGTCTNQVVTALTNGAGPTCSTVTSAMTSGTFSPSAHASAHNGGGGDPISFYDVDPIPASWFIDGGTAPGVLTTLTSTNKTQYRDFSGSANNDVQFRWVVPYGIDTSVAPIFEVWGWITSATGPADGETLKFSLACRSFADQEALSGALGTPVTLTKTFTTGANWVQHDFVTTGFSTAVTVTGFAGGELVICTLTRDVTDTYAQPFGVEWVRIKYAKTIQGS